MPGVELRQVGLVEPDRGLAHARGVDDDALDELEVAAPRRPHADALERAADGRLLARGEVAEARHLLPVEVGARDVLGQVADARDPEPRQPLGHLRADAGERLHRDLGVDPRARGFRRAGVLARERGRRAGYGSPSQ